MTDELEIKERLIRIETIVTLNHESYEKYRDEVTAKIHSVKATADKAHERLDDEIKFRYMASGAFAVIGTLIAAVTLVIKMYVK